MQQDDSTPDSRLSVLEWSLCLILTSIVLVTFTQVLSRYVLQTSLAWTEEIARYLFIWLAALGAAYAFKMKAHFLLRFVTDKFSEKAQMLISSIVTLIMAIFFVVFIWQAILYAQSVSGQFAPGTGLSKAVPASSAVIGGILMLWYSTRNWLDELRDYRLDLSNDGGPD